MKSILESLDEDEEVQEVYSSSMELQSISSILQDTIHSIRSPLEDVVTTETFLDVEGKGKERFEGQYTAFVAGVQRMETYICNYLKVECTLCLKVFYIESLIPQTMLNVAKFCQLCFFSLVYFNIKPGDHLFYSDKSITDPLPGLIMINKQ